MNLSEIHFPQTIPELLTLISREKNIQLIGGATTFGYLQPTRYLSFPNTIAITSRIPELHAIHKTERMISYGAACTLSELEHVYPFEHPQSASLLRTVATSAVRNVATIGGHLMYDCSFLSLWPLFACLDAELEFRAASQSNIKNIWYLVDENGRHCAAGNELLARIRIPLLSIDHIYIKRIGGNIFPGGDGAHLVSLTSVDRRSINFFRLVLAGARAFRDFEAEQRIISASHPLSPKIAQTVLHMYAESLRKTNFWNADLILPLIGQVLEDLQR